MPDPSPFLPNNGLPDYIRGLPPRFQKEDIDYLTIKGALTIPEVPLRNELLRSFVHYVHPFMPILDLEEFLLVIIAGSSNDSNQQQQQRLSLLLFQAVMFAGTAFVDMKHLQAAGYSNRKMARKAFFQRTRLLYDFDYEMDRISLVQALLLMTHWYETPDDQKDTWHWMGVSLSLAHTIGLHRDPANSQMDKRRQQLWKRIWWSTYCRDRLIALGMRRPMRVHDDDSDVPPLTVDDYELKPFSADVVRLLGGSEILTNVDYQTELALMFIGKVKLCLVVSRVLLAQYSVLSHKFGGTMETTMMLVPKKSSAEADEVRRCDAQLENWLVSVPSRIQYSPSVAGVKLSEGEEALHMHRALLKMVHLSTMSALHRPQVLPASPVPLVDGELQEMSRKRVRYAAVEITNVAQDLHDLDLIRFLPTTGVTVILPAIIIHLLDIKASDAAVRMISLQRFNQCMRILQRLREIYASADFATSFLEAAIRKAGIQANMSDGGGFDMRRVNNAAAAAAALTPPPDSQQKPSEGEEEEGQEQMFPAVAMPTMTTTTTFISQTGQSFSVSTPPQSEGSENGSTINLLGGGGGGGGVDDPKLGLCEFMDLANNEAEMITQNDFDSLINFDEEGPDEKFNNNMMNNAYDDFGAGFGDAIPISSASAADFASALVAEREADESKLGLNTMDLGL